MLGGDALSWDLSRPPQEPGTKVERRRRGELELAPITGLLGVCPVSLGNGDAEVEMTAGDRTTGHR